MNLLVPLRPVRDPATLTVNRRAQKVFVNRDNFILNPSDRNALEAAMRLAEARRTASVPGNGQGAHVIAVALADTADSATMTDVLRQALAVGAERAILVHDPALRQPDALVHATVLQRLVAYLESVDVIICGHAMVDADLGQVGPRLAQALDWPLASGAHQLTLAGHTLQAVLQVPDGFHQIEADLPAVVTVIAHSNQPRYAPGATLITVYRDLDALEVLSASAIGVGDLTPSVEWAGESFPPERELGRMVEGDLASQVTEIAGVLRKL